MPWVRRLARQVLTEWGLEGLSDTALLLVSELVTNAVKASAHGGPALGSPGPQAEVAVTLSLTGGRLRIEVWDAHPGPAIPRHPDASAESGRGLLVVEALASSWGQRAADRGKVVWCEIALLPAAAVADAGPQADASTAPSQGGTGGRA